MFKMIKHAMLLAATVGLAAYAAAAAMQTRRASAFAAVVRGPRYAGWPLSTISRSLKT